MATQALDKNKKQESTFDKLAALKESLPKDEAPLSFAIQKNALPSVQELITNGSYPFTQDHHGFSAFDHAVLLKNKEAIASLFEINLEEVKNATISSKTYLEIKEAFNNKEFLAAQNGLIHQLILVENLQIVSRYLKNSSYIYDFNSTTTLSSLHIAAMGSSAEMITLLCNHQFPIDAKDQNGRTPLHYAALNEDKEIFFTLLKKGASILEADALGITPLDLLITESKRKDPLLIQTNEKLNTLALLVTTLIKEGLDSKILGVYSSSAQEALYYLTPLSQIALLLQGTSHSKKMILISSALYFMAQNFTLSRLALNAFILAKAGASCLLGLKEIYYYGQTRPTDTLKKVGMRVIKSSLISYHFFQKYSLGYLKNIYHNLASLKTTSFFETEIGQETKDEYGEISKTFLLDYNTWYESLKSKVQNLFEL